MGCFIHLEAIFDALLELDRLVKKTKSLGRHFYVSGNRIRLLARRTTNFSKRAFFPTKKSTTDHKNLDLSPPSSPRMKVKEVHVPEWRMNYEEFDKQSFKYDDIFDAKRELTPAAIAFNKKSAEIMASKRLATNSRAYNWDYSDCDSNSGDTETNMACHKARKSNKLKKIESDSGMPISGMGRNGKRRLVAKLAGAYFEVSDSE